MQAVNYTMVVEPTARLGAVLAGFENGKSRGSPRPRSIGCCGHLWLDRGARFGLQNVPQQVRLAFHPLQVRGFLTLVIGDRIRLEKLSRFDDQLDRLVILMGAH